MLAGLVLGNAGIVGFAGRGVAEIIAYLNLDGTPRGPPSTYAEREQDPFDHRMVRTVLRLDRMLNPKPPVSH